MDQIRITLEKDPASNDPRPVFYIDGAPVSYATGIKAIRARHGWNAQAFGERIGLSGRTIEDLEQGRRKPALPHLLLMQQFCDQ